MIKKIPYARSLLALALTTTASAAMATIDYHRVTWDSDPSHNAVIAYSQTSGSKDTYVTYGFTTNENNWQDAQVDNTQTFDGSLKSHFVRLTGLPANSPVYYRVCENGTCGDRLWFKTAPDDDTPFVMIAGGDTRSGWETRRKGNELLAKIRPLFIMHGGDFTDANNTSQMKQYLEDFKTTYSSDTIDGVAYKRVYPLVPTLGNHEDDDYRTLCRVFGVDFDGDGNCTTDDTYGAFNVGSLLRVYTLNSQYQESGWSTEGTEQKNWLKNDLESNGSSASWRFAQYHKPFFPHLSSKDENPQLFSWWANTFYDNGMNLVIESDTHLNKVTEAVKPSGNSFVVTTNGGTVFAGEGSWGANARSANKTYAWTLDAASIQQFKVITVATDKVEMRTAQFDAGASTISASERAANTTLLPTGVNWWSANGIGDVLTLTQSGSGLSIISEGDGGSGGGGGTTPAGDVELNASADTFISQNLPGQNFDDHVDQLLADKGDGTYGDLHALIAWNLGSVDSCNQVTAASINVQVTNNSTGTYNIHSGKYSWTEGDATWNSLSGSAQQDILMSSFIPETTGSRSITLDSAGIAVVQSWIDGGDNNGVIISSGGTNNGFDMNDRENGPAAKLILDLDDSGCGGGGTPSDGELFSDDFESGTLTTGNWSNAGTGATEIATAASNGGTYGVRVKKGAVLSKTLSTQGYENISLSYDRATVGFAGSENLTVQWSVDGSNWTTLETTQDTSWASKQFTLPSSANDQGQLTIQFATNGNLNVEKAYIDNVVINASTAGEEPSPEPSDFVENPSFEQNTFWSYYLASRVNNNANTGSYAGQVNEGGDIKATITGLTPNTTYTLSSAVKTTGRVGLYVKDFGGTKLSSISTSSNYANKSVTFTTGASNTSAVIYVYSIVGTSYMDDVSVVAN
ncbi:metallophosphoesterase [Thalassotalea sp. PLHSN55]|uniref:metallophosphoesterase n=1 Tax=Thalassotalea sp. PLHSN55 TaxID=3435888 RepID=UPI003F8573D3